MHTEKARWELHKNTTWSFEQILEATHLQYSHLPPISLTIQVRRTKHAGNYKNKDELISDVLYELINMDAQCWPTNKNLHQLCADTGCNLEDLLGAMKGERVKEICAVDL